MNSIPTLPPICAAWPASRCGKTILVVDDFAPACDLVAGHLSAIGYRVLTANDPMEALGMLRSDAGGVIDLLLTDVEMPKMRGDELAEWCAQARPRTGVVFMSSNPGRVLNTATASVVEKPFSLGELSSVVRTALATCAPSEPEHSRAA